MVKKKLIVTIMEKNLTYHNTAILLLTFYHDSFQYFLSIKYSILYNGII